MKPKDIKFIEKQLGIKLPEFYVSTMLNYPFSEDSWGAEFLLCNNPKRIINLNGVFTKEDKSFSIGSDGGEYYYFIKLIEEEKVYIFDLEGSDEHMSTEANSWTEYLMQIEKTHDKLSQEKLKELERKANRKWWQFWV
ncbi:SMI1/KNR4 family protein [uncultured Aquimarina sp.]|uniref:SMI1/KNR4 family protein n=1 Tax=uncultured Aquimarina sp. TaxID=575652 RepID=UPI0026084B9F|nr:SMI1/KNR4 family protein [uncultured Aquimarina sp.]